MSLRKTLLKRWRYGLALLVLLLLYSRWHYGTINIHLDDKYDQQHPVKALSHQLWLHPFTNRFFIQWQETPKCTMTFVYRRSDRVAWVDCFGGIPDPYIFIDLGEFEVHRFASANGGLQELRRIHPPIFVYEHKSGKEDARAKALLLD